ncbi:MAG TPA: FGGY family carbohydrate kinase, partial [Chitinophagaceae bacterium]|nr:FGGY family carbohydrate kinase [Chitinophagaceae bacterium]
MSTRKNCIITVELGTNAVRVIAFDLDGNTIGSLKGSYPTFHSKPDYSEQDPEQIFITMLYVLKNLLTEKLYPEKYKVISICFSASMHSVLAIDKKGAPLGNAITWADNRAKKEAYKLKNSSHGKTIYTATGTPIHPMSPLLKIVWLKNNDREKFKQASKFLSLKSYIIQQLTGEYLIDYSLASATGMFNIHKLKWDSGALDYAGITADRLPELVPVFHSPGKLRKEYQTSLGLSA